MQLDTNDIVSTTYEEAALELLTEIKRRENNPDANPNNASNVRLALDSQRKVVTANISFPIEIRVSAAGKLSALVVPWLPTIPANAT